MTKFITLSVLALVLGTGFASAANNQGRIDDLCKDALASMNDKDYKQAKVYLTEAFELDPNSEAIALSLCFVSNQAGDYDKAIDAGLHLLQKINKTNSAAFREIGFAYAVKAAQARKNGSDAKAKEYGELATGLLLKSLELKKTDKVTWEFLITHFELSGEKELAAQARSTRDKVIVN
jgi:tetratricopeptide (TPR) repeat protein